jgi:murein DD-endopeptidase MepM/ murein hydrolase activator NlpD
VQHQLPVLEVCDPGQASEVRRQEAVNKPPKRTQVSRFRDEWLQFGIDRQDAVDLGWWHGIGREGLVQIILVSDGMAKARSLNLTLRHYVGTTLLGLALLCAATAGLYWLTLRYASEIRAPALQRLVLSAQEAEAERGRAFVQQNLNAMAVKLGEMQAQLTRLDALGERLSSTAGIREFRFTEAPGLGGATPTMMPPQNLSLAEFSDKLALLSRQVETRNDMMGVLEAQLFEQAVKKKLTPTITPVSAPFNASGFGRRIDPFTGQWAMHEGIDFLADIGSPVVSAAGGIVQFAGFHPQYGYMIDIDHGNDLVTRYAHLSKLFVKEGDVVQRAKRIALSGNTGRSTGPHVHFEVRFRGAAQNPARFVSTSATPVAQAK